MTITTPVALWRELCLSAGLELRLKGGRPGRDADIEDALRAALAAPSTAKSLEAWLASDILSPRPTVTVEQLLVEVLKSQGGFAQMMQDILSMLITANAQRAAHNLSVSFKFDELTDPIVATLKQFQETVQRTKKVLETRPKLPNSNLMWPISEVLRNFLSEHPKSRPPDFPPTHPIVATNHHRLDTQLARLARLVSDFIELWKRHGPDRQQVFAAAIAMPISTSDENVLSGQLKAATDFWDVGVLAGAQEISNQVISGRLLPDKALERLTEALDEVEWMDVWVDQTIQELLDILALPAWRRRHELYSVWVGTRLLRAVEQEAPDICFHLIKGVLSFEFGGSRLATFDWNGEQFDIWAELRSALVGKSFKRKKGIQPDFRVVRADLSGSPNARTTYVLECKHYLHASTLNFTQAAADYARSCPNAVVHVVNHGPADDSTMRALLHDELKNSVRFIGGATPLEEVATQALSSAIRDALFPGQPLPASNPSAPEQLASKIATSVTAGCVGYILLEWDDSLNDMDLALQVIEPNGQVTMSIDYRCAGALDGPPFACFGKDVRVGPGMERIDISAWHFNRYKLVATNYSETGLMKPQTLHCSIVTETGQTQLHCPEGLAATCYEWSIAELLVSNGVVNIVPRNL